MSRTPLDAVDPLAPVGTIVASELDGEPVAVVRSADGWVAVDDSCPHAICPFDRDGDVLDGEVLACVCHGSEFDLRTGQVRLGPADRPLTVRPLDVADGHLVRRPTA